MNRLRCFLFAVIMVLSSATFALGGEIQGPGKSDPTPTPTPTALTNASTSNGLTRPTSIGTYSDCIAGRHDYGHGDPANNLLIALGYS